MKIAIIGAGIGGLTAAYDLQKNGHDITVFDRENQPGGLAAGFRENQWDWSLEKYYHHWFSTDKAILSLIAELGLSKKVIFIRPKTVVCHEGTFYPLDSAGAVLKFPGFSFIDKIRFGIVTVYLKYLSGWRNLEKITAVKWIKRFYGDNLYEVFFKPMLVGKFSDHYKDVNMAWFWARFKARSAKLGTYQGGFQAFLDQFTEVLSNKGVHFSFNTNISSIKLLKNEKIELTIQEKKLTFDQVLATISPKVLANITPQLGGEYLENIKEQKSIGTITVIFSLTNKLSRKGYYWFNLPKSPEFPFLALVEHTNFLSEDHFNNEHLIYCGDYLDHTHPFFSMKDEELSELFIPSLKRINPAFSKEWVNNTWVYKTPYAQPIPHISHSKNILDIKTPIQGLFLASMSQVYPWDRGTNYAVALAHHAVKAMSICN